MNVNFSAIQNNNSIFQNAHITNQNAVKQKGTSKQSQQANHDKVSLSPQGKSSNTIKNLQKQKQALMQRKSEIRTKAMEDGSSAQDINALLESYDMQIKNIDAQIAKIQSEETKKAMEPKEYNKNTPKSQQNAEKQKINDLTALSVSAEQADTMYSVKRSIDAEKNVLESEIELDKQHDAGESIIEKKENKVAELEHRSGDLMGDIGETLGETQKQYDSNKVEEQKTENETLLEKMQLEYMEKTEKQQ